MTGKAEKIQLKNNMVYNMNMNEQFISNFIKGSDYPIIREHILKCMVQLTDYSGLEEKTNEQIGEIIRGRLEAHRVLAEILKPFEIYTEREEITPEQIQRAKNKYGIQ